MCVSIYIDDTTDSNFAFHYSSLFASFSLVFISWGSLLFSAIQASAMVDLQTVCCLCGDVGFPDKLFRCTKCHHRFQHSYCSNYYNESSELIELCDWCQSEERNARHGSSSKKSGVIHIGSTNRSEYPGDKVKQNEQEDVGANKGKNTNGAPSPRPSARRYKLLKDVMC